MEDVNFDLLGDPIPEGFGKRGRPEHRPSDEKRKLVIALAAFDKTLDEIASALGITQKTLRKHYSRELREKDEARMRVEGGLITAMLREVEAGNVSAMNALWKRLDKHDLSRLAAARAMTAGKDKPGKKKQAVEAAKGITGKFAPPPQPGRLN